MKKVYAQIKNLKYYDEDYIALSLTNKGNEELLNNINDYLREVGEFSFLFKNCALIIQESALFHIMMKYDQIGFR